jgi:hypothetical protein
MVFNPKKAKFDNLFNFVKPIGIALFSLIALTGFAQSGTILVNGSGVPVSSGTKFPIWLPGGSGQSINIGSNVTSISGILYNITPSTAGGNIMTVNSVVYITGATSIAAGTALKVEGILFSTTSSSTSTTWNVGGNTTPPSPVIGSTDNSPVSIQSGTGSLNIGADAAAKTITLGNTVAGTAINENVGANYTLTGVAGSAYNIGVNTTTGSISTGGSLTSGAINIGGTSQTGTITVGTGPSTPINIGGSTSTTTIGHNAVVAGALNVGSTETVTGLVTQNGGLTETGAANINATGSATTTIGNAGSATNVGGTETVTGLVTQNGGLTETGAASINGTGSAATTIGNASSATTVGGALYITGNLAQINGATYTWPTSSTCNAGYVLTNNGSGVLSWSSVMGAVETAGSTPGATSSSANSATWTTPGAYIATVPSGVTKITVDMAGAQGGTAWNYLGATSYSLGGYGGRMVASYPVTPGSTIYISVGGAGGSSGIYTGGGGGYLNDAGGGAGTNYTASGPYYGSGGGGASDIRIGGTALANRVLVAGGGGGAAGHQTPNNLCNGGPGGASTAALGAGYHGGVQGELTNTCGTSTGGGGTVSGPGAGGCYNGYANANSGGSGYGGSSTTTANAGGGGGGGYFGGGGGMWGGGGGGANYANGSAISPVSTTGYQGSNWYSAPLNGYVTIYWH